MRTLLACAALAGVLAACGPTTTIETPEAPADVPGPAQPSPLPPLPPVPRDAAAGPSGEDNMTWHFGNRDGQRPSLRYASYGTEDQAIALQCEAGTAYAILWRGQQRESWPFTLQSGVARADLNGVGEGDSEVFVTGTLPMSSPVIRAFRDTSDLTVSEGGRTWVMDAINDQERSTIGQFFAACS